LCVQHICFHQSFSARRFWHHQAYIHAYPPNHPVDRPTHRKIAIEKFEEPMCCSGKEFLLTLPSLLTATLKTADAHASSTASASATNRCPICIQTSTSTPGEHMVSTRFTNQHVRGACARMHASKATLISLASSRMSRGGFRWNAPVRASRR
jgi:hypothetical protein